MALAFDKAKCELPQKNNTMTPEKIDDLPSSQWSIPGNPVENLVSSQRSSDDPAVDDHYQIMYCKDQVYKNDGTEFSFEELRAQRYYKSISERLKNLDKLKHDLQLQIEQKQRFIQQRNSTSQQQAQEIVESDSSIRTSEDACQSVSAAIKSTNKQTRISEEESACGVSEPKVPKMTTSRPFSVSDENPQSHKTSSSTNRRSLKLPTLSLKAPQLKAERLLDKDASISRSEEPIINGHWNKTLCRSPNDTSDFARAAQLASTPFGGTERQKVTDDLSTTSSEAPRTSNSDVITETRKLSPIQEISHNWGGTSFTTVVQETIKHSDNTDISQDVERSDIQTVDEVKTEVNEDVCSQDVRARLLDKLDMTSFSNFHHKTGLLPPAAGNDNLLLDDEKLVYHSKLENHEEYSLYLSRTGTVVVKVDSSSVAWDFFISSKIRSLSTDNVQISCYVYENGSMTVWRVPDGVTIEHFLFKSVDEKLLKLIIGLLELVKQIHSCHIVHGGLKPETLYFSHSDVIALDFSSSVDLQLQTDVRSVEVLSSAQDYIKQGLLKHSASPYQVDLIGVAEIVHMFVLHRPLKVVHGNSGWSLDEDSESHQSPVDDIWKRFFHVILNPEDQSTEVILSSLISDLKD